MQHLIRRCKHCGKAYTYCTYGNGPEYGTQEGCSMDYCAECQNAIDDALSKIPLRIVKKYTLINDTKKMSVLARYLRKKRRNIIVPQNLLML